MYKLTIVVLSILCFIMCKPSSNSSSTEIKNIEAESVYKKLSNNNTILIDVRTPSEISEGKIEGAKEIDYRSKDFKTQIAQLDKTKEYIIYCRSGGRSKKATEIMNELQFENVSNMIGGFENWKSKYISK